MLESTLFNSSREKTELGDHTDWDQFYSEEGAWPQCGGEAQQRSTKKSHLAQMIHTVHIHT